MAHLCLPKSGPGIGRIRGPTGADGTGTCSNGDDRAQTDHRSGLFDPSFVLFVLRPGAAQTDSSNTAYGEEGKGSPKPKEILHRGLRLPSGWSLTAVSQNGETAPALGALPAHPCGSLLAALDVHPRVLTIEIYTQVPDRATREALKRLSDQLGQAPGVMPEGAGE